MDIDVKAHPFDQFRNIQRLSRDRSGRDSSGHARHDLFVGRDKKTALNWLIKVASKPGVVYQANLLNEIATLTTINESWPDDRTFPHVREHGKLRDSRVYLVISLFDELPLAASIGPERMPARLVGHVRTAIAVAQALTRLHGLQIFHVDLNPMNILYRSERGRPVIRIVDFESSYEVARHAHGEFYNPPTTPGFSAPEVSSRPPDARSDLYSLAAVLYTMIAGYEWTWGGELAAAVDGDRELDSDLRDVLREAVASDPDNRLSSVDLFATALRDYLERIWPGRDV
jgi:serine/threonine protein kinase